MSKQQLVDKYPWLRPGMQFRDPETGVYVRANRDLVLAADSEADMVLWGRWRDRLSNAEAYPDGGDYSALALRALDDGPVYADLATLGAMALTVPGSPGLMLICAEWEKHWDYRYG